MADITVKQFMAYSLLVVGYLVVRKYITISSDMSSPPPPPGSTVEDLASAIIELTENMEYVRNHAFHIPRSDEEALAEVVAWMNKAREDLGALMDKYIQESRLDVTGKDIMEVEDRRGRQVRLSLKYKYVAEFPDEIGYRQQVEVLKNTPF